MEIVADVVIEEPIAVVFVTGSAGSGLPHRTIQDSAFAVPSKLPRASAGRLLGVRGDLAAPWRRRHDPGRF